LVAKVTGSSSRPSLASWSGSFVFAAAKTVRPDALEDLRRELVRPGRTQAHVGALEGAAARR
jgi:hypothetical protein